MTERAAKTGEPKPSSRWLFGPIPDLVFGCGVAYMAVFVVLAAVGPDVAVLLPMTLLALLPVVAGGPHYGATLLRAYEAKSDRVAYRRVTIFASLALLCVFLISLEIHILGSLVISLYLLWSPWHYSGQNYGVALMFLGRRGISVSPPLKRWIWATFVLSFLLVIVQLNGETPVANYVPGVQPASGNPIPAPFYKQLSLSIPTPIQTALFWVFAAAYLGAVGVAGVGLARLGSLRDLLPPLAIVLSQSLWFSVPAMARQSGESFGLLPLDEHFAIYTFNYIAAAHAFQYIWITMYFHRRTHGGGALGIFYGKSMLTGQLIWGLPLLMFAPLMIGSLSFSFDLALLVAASVNLHHFILDGALWKLRDRKVGEVLIADSSKPAAAAAPGRSWILRGACVLGAVFVASQIASGLEGHAFATALKSDDPQRAEQALDRLSWFGQDAFESRIDLAFLSRERGDLDGAIRAFERSIELRPTPRAWFEKAQLHAQQEQWALASDSYAGAYAMAPFPPSYTADYVRTLVYANRLNAAREVLNAERSKYPQDPVLMQMARELGAG